MRRTNRIPALLLAAALAAGCDSDEPITPTDPGTTAPEISETFSETLTINGARTHTFVVGRAGTVTARIAGPTSEDSDVVGLSLGTWNGVVCQIILANDNATLNTATASVTGTASTAGNFCVRVYDVGRLTRSLDYSVTVTHF